MVNHMRKCADRSLSDGSHVAGTPAGNKVGQKTAKDRLRLADWTLSWRPHRFCAESTHGGTRRSRSDRTGCRAVHRFRYGKNPLSAHFSVQRDPCADRRRISLNFLKLRTPTLQNINPKSPATSRLITNTIVSSV